jgi:ribosome-binding protein aMBF1 (putative translation factor)
MAGEGKRMKKTNFDTYLDEQMKDPAFAERFKRAGTAWNIALQIAALRKQAGLSQKDLAHELKTSQQQISRLESPEYEGHSLSMLRRVADALDAELKISLEPNHSVVMVAEEPAQYTTRSKSSARRSR